MEQSPKEYTQAEQDAMTDARIDSDAELRADGAKTVGGRLEVSADQIEGARAEMEKDLAMNKSKEAAGGEAGVENLRKRVGKIGELLNMQLSGEEDEGGNKMWNISKAYVPEGEEPEGLGALVVERSNEHMDDTWQQEYVGQVVFELSPSGGLQYRFEGEGDMSELAPRLDKLIKEAV